MPPAYGFQSSFSPHAETLGQRRSMHRLAMVAPAHQRRSINRRTGKARSLRQTGVRADSSNGTRPEPRVVCFGEALFDCLANDLGVPMDQVKSWTPYPGGAPANVATALGRMGAAVNFVSAIGDDDLGKQMMELLRSRNVDVSGVQSVHAPTRDVLVTRDHSGDRTFAGFGAAKNNQYADCLIDKAKLPTEAIRNSTALVTGTLGLAFPTTGAAMREAISLAKAGPCCILVDVNWRPVFWDGQQDKAQDTIAPYVAQADLVKLEEYEAEWLYGVPAAQALEDPARVLKALGTAEGVLVTAGGAGSSFAFQTHDGKVAAGRVPVLDIQVADTTGAGDAFLSGFLFSMVKAGGLRALQSDPDKLHEAMQLATACGAFTCTKPGAIDAHPTLEEARQLLQKSSFARA